MSTGSLGVVAVRLWLSGPSNIPRNVAPFGHMATDADDELDRFLEGYAATCAELGVEPLSEEDLAAFVVRWFGVPAGTPH